MNYRIQNITYQYAPDGKEVLKDVSLEIRRSAVTAVVGPSGCGKTTLVDILSGVIPKLESNGVLQGELELGENALVSVVSQSPENQLFGYGVEDAIAFGMENMACLQRRSRIAWNMCSTFSTCSICANARWRLFRAASGSRYASLPYWPCIRIF